MQAVIQRVSEAAVRVDEDVVGQIGRGLLVLQCVEPGDGEEDARALVRKLVALRMFPGRTPLDQTVEQVGGGILLVSQFTLAASLRKGNRPSLDGAAPPALAESLYAFTAAALAATGVPTATGRFGASMRVSSTNEGPVTFLLRIREGCIQG